MQLVIVRRSQFAAFGRLSQVFADTADVRLIWDRRVLDRRRQTNSPGISERPGRDRREDPLSSWGDRDYVIAQGAEGVVIEVEQTIPSAHALDVQMAGHDVRQDLEAAVRSDINVLITGGDPVSRETLARRIHGGSDRHDRPFVILDRRAAAELFGKPGLPSTAAALGWRAALERLRDRLGREGDQSDAWPKDLGDRGTVLIEEVVDLSWDQQTELLAYLERRAVRADGTRATPASDPRVIAASSGRLLDRVGSTEFRPDLYYRLNLIHLLLPLGTLSRSYRAPLTTR